MPASRLLILWPGTRLVTSTPSARESTSHWARPALLYLRSLIPVVQRDPLQSSVLSEPLFPDTFKPPPPPRQMTGWMPTTFLKGDGFYCRQKFLDMSQL